MQTGYETDKCCKIQGLRASKALAAKLAVLLLLVCYKDAS